MEEKQMSNDKPGNSREKRKLNPKDNSRRQFNPSNHSLQKRPTSKPFQRKNDIYVSNKTNFKVKKKTSPFLVLSFQLIIIAFLSFFP